MHKFLIVLFLSAVLTCHLRAAEKDYPFTDSTLLVTNLIQDEDLQVYLNDEDFEYLTESTLGRDNNFWLNFFNLLKKGWEKFGGLVGAIPWIVHLIFWAAVIFLVVIIFTKTRLNRIFFSEKEINLLEYKVSDADEIIEDFDLAIKSEINKGNYRKALRLLFLKLINSLDDQNLISYSKEKTNTDYLCELPNNEIREEFRRLVNIYNNVWYGLFGIDKQEYHDFEKSFLKVFASLNVEK